MIKLPGVPTVVLLTFVGVLAAILPADASWQEDGVVVCDYAGHQTRPKVISDDSNGAIIAWKDARSPAGIYAQRLDADGNRLWTPEDDVEVCSSDDIRGEIQIISDGSGGAIIAWEDGRNTTDDDSEIYVQRLDGDGVTHWGPNGLLVGSSGDPLPALQQLTWDESGGAIITWEDQIDIFAQRVDGSGSVVWPTPTEICGVVNQQTVPQIAADGLGGAIITWEDHRNDPNIQYEVYAQRVNSAGEIQWTAGGIEIRNANVGEKNWDPQIVTDDSNGAIICWEDTRGGIFAQRVDGGGATQWEEQGNHVCTTVMYYLEDKPDMVADESGGAIIVWRDYRNDEADLYAQRIYGHGGTAWDFNGVDICTAEGVQANPQLVSDGSGGAGVTWNDERSDDGDIWAQKVGPDGTVEWGSTGIAVCTEEYDQKNPQLTPITDGAIVVWRDSRDCDDRDIYADRLDYPTSGIHESNGGRVSGGSNLWPNPTGWSTSIEYSLGHEQRVVVDVCDVAGRLVRTLVTAVQQPGSQVVTWDGKNEMGVEAAQGVYLIRAKTDDGTIGKKVVISR